MIILPIPKSVILLSCIDDRHKPLVTLVMDLVLNQPTVHGMAQWWPFVAAEIF